MMKFVLVLVPFLAAALPTLAVAETPFAGTWVIQPELTTFAQRSMTVMIERGIYKRSDCTTALEVPADGSEQAVKGQPLFDHMSVRIVDSGRVEIEQKMAGKRTWKGLYTVSKDRRSMTLAFEDDRPAKAVTGVIKYVREGEPLSGAHALSGTWRPEKLVQLSQSALTLAIQDKDDGIALSWSDGRSTESKLDAKYNPLNGYLDGATMSVLRPRPDTLAINQLQNVVPVEVSRLIISDDNRTLTNKRVDWLCQAMTVFVYHREPPAP
jgi:hypothetical protein